MPSVPACAVGVSAEVVPLRVSEIVTRLPASAVPVMVGVVALVRLSVVVPVVPVPALSEAVARSMDVGATGAVASMVTVSDVDAELRLLAPSNAVAVNECVPSASGPVVIDHVPVELVGGAPSAISPDVTAVPTRVVPS